MRENKKKHRLREKETRQVTEESDDWLQSELTSDDIERAELSALQFIVSIIFHDHECAHVCVYVSDGSPFRFPVPDILRSAFRVLPR